MEPNNQFQNIPVQKNHLVSVCIAVILVLIALNIATVFYMKDGRNMVAGDETIQNATTSTNMMIPQTGLKTYAGYGSFTFQYPANLFRYSMESTAGVNLDTLFEARSTFLPQEFGGALPPGSMGVDFTDQGYDIYLDSETLTSLKDYQKIDVSNVTAYKFIGEWDSPGCGADTIYINDTTSTRTDDYIGVNFCARSNEGYAEGKAAQMQIVKSFKFTNTLSEDGAGSY